MLYTDHLYGPWHLPEVVARLVQTPEAQRSHGITQSVIPNSLHVRGPVPSRLQHGLGVCFLAYEVLKHEDNHKRLEGSFARVLPIAALVHDWGNPPFTHLAEPFMKKVIGLNGETQLAEILDGSEAERVMKDYGVGTTEVTRYVTGGTEGAKVLHGSLDIDNVDNVMRHGDAYRLNMTYYDGIRIARAFRFDGNIWYLDAEVKEDCLNWQKARAELYGEIYDGAEFPAHAMVSRALDFALEADELKREFFRLNDESALAYLQRCNIRTLKLIDHAMHWRWYQKVWELMTTIPSEKFLIAAKAADARADIASKISDACKIPPENVAVHISAGGKEHRRIKLPFRDKDGNETFDESEVTPTCRARVFVHPEHVGDGAEIGEFMQDLVG